MKFTMLNEGDGNDLEYCLGVILDFIGYYLIHSL